MVRVGAANRDLLSAVRAGAVQRTGPGWQLAGVNVGLDLHFLHARGLVHLPLDGPPRLTCDGETALDELELPD